jgi:3-oxoacyl-[acyl-carrier-protein] synthase II
VGEKVLHVSSRFPDTPLAKVFRAAIDCFQNGLHRRPAYEARAAEEQRPKTTRVPVLGLPSALGLLPEGIDFHPSIVGLGALSSLGYDVESHFQTISRGETAIRPLGELLGNDSRHAHHPGAWIGPRRLLTHRKWSPASMAALHVARQAVAAAGWDAGQLAGAALIVGTSRGNAAGWLGPWPGRRPFKLMAASNTIHSEPATAISIELGMFGPNHLVASGCSAGLDALGLAKILLDAGHAERALVVAVDLPLVPMLLDNYADSGLLGNSTRLNPFSPTSDGFIPAEGAAAIALSVSEKGRSAITHFSNNSDGADPVGVPEGGGRTSSLFDKATATCGEAAAICPHATGTKVQAAAERAFLSGGATLHLLKPFIGHTVGASGLLESVILLRYMEDKMLPPNLPGTVGACGMLAPEKPVPCHGPVYKLAHGMGGHNSIAVFQTHP